jgi:hypothetical protein
VSRTQGRGMFRGAEFRLLGAVCASGIDSGGSSHSLPAGMWGCAITYYSVGTSFPR